MDANTVTDEMVRSIVDHPRWCPLGEQRARNYIVRIQELLLCSVQDATDFILKKLSRNIDNEWIQNEILVIARTGNISPKEILIQDDGGSCATFESSRAFQVYLLLYQFPEPERTAILDRLEVRFREINKVPFVWT